jgi:biotin transport system substrate-specific component
MAVNALERYRVVRDTTWRQSRQLSWIKKIALSLGVACLIGLLAQTRILLPWSPVPITGQTFGVFIGAILLGQWWGGVSLAFYVGLGIAGVHWFNGGTGGLAAVVGPTGGYLIGFILAALFLGYFVDKYVKARSFGILLGLMLFADLVFVFVPGLLQLHFWLGSAGKNTIGFYQLLTMGLLPFIPGEIIKATAGAGAAWALSPKKESRE